MMPVKAANQDVRTSRTKLCVEVYEFRIELIISGRQFYAEIHARREVRRKSSVKRLDSHIAELTPVISHDFSGIILRSKTSEIIWHFNLNAPASIKQILQSHVREVGFDLSIVVV